MDSDEDAAFAGLRVLILEDDALLSMLLAETLADFGCRVVGNFPELDAALAFIEAQADGIDIALLDVNLGSVQSYPAAERLTQRRIPFLFATGGDEASVDDAWRQHPRIAKPFSEPELRQRISEAVAHR